MWLLTKVGFGKLYAHRPEAIWQQVNSDILAFSLQKSSVHYCINKPETYIGNFLCKHSLAHTNCTWFAWQSHIEVGVRLMHLHIKVLLLCVDVLGQQINRLGCETPTHTVQS